MIGHWTRGSKQRCVVNHPVDHTIALVEMLLVTRLARHGGAVCQPVTNRLGSEISNELAALVINLARILKISLTPYLSAVALS